jgi:hypothetical protein
MTKHLKKLVLLFALAFALAGCKHLAVDDKGKPAAMPEKSKTAAPASKDKPAVTVPDTAQPLPSSDKDVYQALLNYISANVSTTRKVAFSEQPVDIENVFHPSRYETNDPAQKKIADKFTPSAQLQSLLPAIPEKLAAGFIEKLQAGGAVTEADIAGTNKIKPVFINQAALNVIFSVKDAWQHFHDNFPGVKSLVRVSRPAIDPDSDLAVVYLGVYCGVDCGEGDLFLLGKLKGKWLVVHKQRMWVNHE